MRLFYLPSKISNSEKISTGTNLSNTRKTSIGRTYIGAKVLEKKNKEKEEKYIEANKQSRINNNNKINKCE